MASCAAGCCGTTNAAKGTACTDNGGVVCDGNGMCVAAHCMDGVKDGDETDADCGGATCSPCADGLHCLVGTDCLDKVCDPAQKTCSAPTCTDMAKNGTETDVDCGGAVCDAAMKTCAVGKTCAAAADCTSGFCGPMMTCALRPDGQPCTANGDCANAHCVGSPGSQVCCNTACNGTCQACTMGVTGQPDGTCANVTPGLPAPTGQCVTAGTCGNDGKCAANGMCEQVPNCTCAADEAIGATAVMSSGGAGAYGPQNINDGLSQTQTCNFAWVSSGGSPSGAFFELDWVAAVTVRSIYVDTVPSSGYATCAVPAGRNILSGSVDWWNGSSWVTATTFNGKLDDFQLDLPAAVTTTKLRIFNITDSPGNGNAVMCEWHVYSGVGCMPPP